jgi:hypothetical protein
MEAEKAQKNRVKSATAPFYSHSTEISRPCQTFEAFKPSKVFAFKNKKVVV